MCHQTALETYSILFFAVIYLPSDFTNVLGKQIIYEFICAVANKISYNGLYGEL